MKRKEGKRGYVVGEEARRGIGVKAKRYATAAVHFTRYERSRRCQRCIFNSSIESATFDSVTRLDRTLTFLGNSILLSVRISSSAVLLVQQMYTDSD